MLPLRKLAIMHAVIYTHLSHMFVYIIVQYNIYSTIYMQYNNYYIQYNLYRTIITVQYNIQYNNYIQYSQGVQPCTVMDFNTAELLGDTRLMK